MSGHRRRPRRVRSFRNQESEGDDAARAAAGAGDRDDQIVVHVHVHRDGKVATAMATPATTVRERRVRRPTLSGALFPWKEHYEPVAKRHHEALTTPRLRPLEQLAKALRHVRNLTLAFATYLFVRR